MLESAWNAVECGIESEVTDEAEIRHDALKYFTVSAIY